MPSQNKFDIRKLQDIQVLTNQINFKAQVQNRYKKPIERWEVYRIKMKYLFGVPIEYIALQYDITLEEANRIIEESKKSTYIMKMAMRPSEYYAEAFQFFLWLGTPLHIMARLFRTTPDKIINYIRDNKNKISYWTWRAAILQKKGMSYDYLETEQGKARLKHIQKMIKWKE